MPYLAIEKIPRWLVDILPQDIVAILKQKFVEPKSKGRKSSIDIDNPNDFKYYMTMKGRKDPFETKIKGTDDTAVEYVFKNKKYKCIACLLSFFPSFGHPVTPEFIKEAPKWLQYLYIIWIDGEFENYYLSAFTKAGPDYLYDIFMNCPNPLSLLEIIIKKSEEIYEAHKNPKFLKRTKIDKNADSSFYKSLSEPDKDKIINLMHQEKIFLDIDDDIIEEGNTSRILLLYGYYKLAEYCVKKEKINEFEKIASQNEKDFNNFSVCKIIMPQFRKAYGHVYGSAHINNDNEKIYSEIHEHASKLAYHGFYVELEFLFKHGFRFKDPKEISVFLKKVNQKTLDVFPREQIYEGVNYLAMNSDEAVFEFAKKGFYPKLSKVFYNFQYVSTKLYRSLRIFDALDPNARFDKYKYCILTAPDLLELFIKKYGDRCKINTPESWDLYTCKTREDFERVCEILGFDKNTTKYKNEPERNSDDDDNSDDNESDDDDDDDDDYDYKRKQHKDQKNTKQKTTYICKYCGIKTAVRNFSGNCSRSPNHKHSVFDDSGRTNFYCEYCGKSTKQVSGFCSGICNRSPSKHHILYSGPEQSRYSCKYCGSKQSTITRLCSGQCNKSPTKFHVASS